ncbi:hypothetical protein B0H63DRAFT_25464 [Podospora didyma]|uniref:Mitochondrial distribution and morphology protein 12 n=1 Tax=Podospora didyma TaxID=330526 RepID=A0AAE0U7S0_9PEZI|nr:hypothetical protein B0H63DRAFT_25464 [Podospora didyma]
MSIDLNWDTVTGGPDGQELALRIRDFIHTKFQSVPLPRFIKSVTVHDFEFGSIPPEIELKDITDPLPDFYEENSGQEDESSSEEEVDDVASHVPDELRAAAERRRRAEANEPNSGTGGGGIGAGGRTGHLPPHLGLASAGSRSSTFLNDLGSPFFGASASTPGFPGGTSNLHYFHSHFASGLSGAQTPLAAVAGAHHLSNAWLELGAHGESSSAPNLQRQYASFSGGGVNGPSHQPSHSRHPSQSSISVMDFNQNAGMGMTPVSQTTPSGVAAAGLGIVGGSSSTQQHALREKHSVSTLAPTSAGTSRPPTRDAAALVGSAIAEDEESDPEDGRPEDGRRFRERRIEDIQAVFRIKYAGDIKLLLTADILLDYPMPSFVGIPVRLSITGLTFDGVGVLAHIRKRVHFCFLSPEDAQAAVGGDENAVDDEPGRATAGSGPGGLSAGTKMGGLLQEIRVESEIGQRESGKQSLKNVGKVERFVLEQVRRIFEEEFVYPSFWTFLV